MITSFLCHVFEEMPDRYSSGHGDVKGMLGAALRDFKAYVALVYNRLFYPVHLMPEYQRISAPLLWNEFMEVNTPFHLFKAAKCVTLALEPGDAAVCRGMVFPCHRVFCAKGCLVDFR